jgi:CRP/FNR family transcriptional regulator, cyclic AMP receptor protein
VTSASSTFLARLQQPELDGLAQRWNVRNYRHNEAIIAHRDSGCEVFFLLEGRARVTLFSEGGREIAYRDVGPGEIFGELAGIDGKPRSASVVALETARAARLPEAAFRDMVSTHPVFAWALLDHLSAQLRRMTDRVFEYSTLVVRKRLILELLREASESEKLDGKPCISPAPSHVELAAKISSHREAVSREMSTLAKRGLIEKRGSRLVLCKPETLELLIASDE